MWMKRCVSDSESTVLRQVRQRWETEIHFDICVFIAFWTTMWAMSNEHGVCECVNKTANRKIFVLLLFCSHRQINMCAPCVCVCVEMLEGMLFWQYCIFYSDILFQLFGCCQQTTNKMAMGALASKQARAREDMHYTYNKCRKSKS